VFSGGGARDRNGRPITGVAVLRPASPGGVTFGPWGRWYPWYSSGFGMNVGYMLFDPWQYGMTSWVWGRYGMWPYDPFYDPFYYPYGYSSSYGYGADSSSYPAHHDQGSLRLRMDPATAQVYVDGVLHGSVDDFSGLTKHLQLDAGSHLLEVKADGYETYSSQISVTAGKTVTYRASLKKKK
jgi:hypothetical protein